MLIYSSFVYATKLRITFITAKLFDKKIIN